VITGDTPERRDGAGPGLELAERHIGRLCVISACGEIDIATAPALADRLANAGQGRRDIVLDLSGCEFMDCRALHALLDAQRGASRRRRRLIIAGAREPVRRVFALTRTAEKFEFASTAFVAMARLADPAVQPRARRRRRGLSPRRLHLVDPAA
jgi:anti-anti-sigma factor